MEVMPSHPLNKLTAIYVPKNTIGDGLKSGGVEKKLYGLSLTKRFCLAAMPYFLI